MSKLINFALRTHNRTMCDQFLDDATQRNAEIFFAVGVSIDTKDLQLFYANAGGIERVIDTMEQMLKALKEAQLKKKKGLN